MLAIYFGIISMGPGLYSATMAITWLSFVGCIWVMKRVMPVLSSWKTPVVWPSPRNLNTSGSSVGMSRKFSRIPCLLAIYSVALAMMVSVTNPKKSTFSRPSSLIPFMSYCDTDLMGKSSLWLVGRCKGRYSVRGLSLMMTPAACVPTLRMEPSIRPAVSISFLICSDESYMAFKSGVVFRHSEIGACIPWEGPGTALATRSTSGKGISITRPTSRMAPRAFMALKVMICATLSAPYLRLQYSITSARRSSWKSRSISGIVTRSGFRKRSNINWCSSGSTEVISRANATREPLPEPRTLYQMFCSREKRHRSHTMRKYSAKPIWLMIPSSYFRRC